MSYIIKIKIADDFDEFTREKIQKNLNQDTLRVPIFPKDRMPLELIDDTLVLIDDVVPRQEKDSLSPAARATIKPFKPKI